MSVTIRTRIPELENRNRIALGYLAKAVQAALRVDGNVDRVSSAERALRAYNAARRELKVGDEPLRPLLVWCDNLAEAHARAEYPAAVILWSDLVKHPVLS